MHLQENSELSCVLKDVQPQVCRRSKQTPIRRAVINNCSKYHLPSPVTLAALGDDCPTVLLSVPTWGGLELSNACDPDMQVTSSIPEGAQEISILNCLCTHTILCPHQCAQKPKKNAMQH